MSKRRKSKKTIEEREREILERMRKEEEAAAKAEASYLEMDSRAENDAIEMEEEESTKTEEERAEEIAKRSEERKARAKKGEKRRLRVPSLAAILIIVFIFIAGFATIRNIMSLKLEHSRLEKENEELTKRRDKLRIELKHVNSKEYIEEQARRQLRLVNPDEILFIFKSEDEEENREE